ncbi:hypothetical protein A2U01_0087157, partial [Trifolium medium]|nr:hypothetical protein [Trifolium medium]
VVCAARRTCLFFLYVFWWQRCAQS